MYLIIQKNDYNTAFSSTFTDCIIEVAEALAESKGRVFVYKLDSLTQITDVEIKEIVKECNEAIFTYI